MEANDRRRSVSVSSLSGYPMEVNTQVNIGNHVGETNVGAVLVNHNATGETSEENEEPKLHLNEQIQININGTAPVTIEAPKKDPTINIVNYGPTITLTPETIRQLKSEGEWLNFLKMIYNLSMKMRDEIVKEDIVEQSATAPARKNIRIDDTCLTICFEKPNYSLKGSSQPSIWAKVVPEKYVSMTRSIVSVCMICITIAAIYGIVIVIMEYK